MYENMVENFQWGNVDNEEVYMDENNLRMTTNLRLQFSNLAETLISEGKTEKAKTALKRCLEVMPEKNVPYNRVMTPIVESLLKVEEKELAKEIIVKLYENQKQDAKYYMQLDPENLRPLSEDLQINFAIANRMVSLAKFAEMDIADSLAADIKELEMEVQNTLQNLERETKRYSF